MFTFGCCCCMLKSLGCTFKSAGGKLGKVDFNWAKLSG